MRAGFVFATLCFMVIQILCVWWACPCNSFYSSIRIFLKNIFYCLCHYSCPIYFLPFIPLCSAPSLSPASLPLSSCPWVVSISSLASPFPILLLTSPCLFCTYHLCFLFPVPFPPFSPIPLPADNPPCECGLHFCDSIPVLVVCLISFGFFFKVQSLIVVFVVILMFVFLIIFFLDKSL